MRRSLTRFAPAGLLAALLAALVGHVGGDVSGQPGLPVPAKKDKAKSDTDDDGVFVFPEDRDSKQQLKAARDYLDRKDIPWNIVCSVLQNILDAKSDTFFRVDEKKRAALTADRISVKTEANRIIGAFQKEGLQFYQQTYGQGAAALLKEGIDAGYERATLSDVSQRFFHTRAGAEATVLLGTIHLDRGNYLEAAYAFERLMARPESEPFLTPRTMFKAALALQRSGDPRHAEKARQVWDQLERQVGRNGLAVGRKTFSADGLKKELDRPVPTVLATATAAEWAMRYGTASRTGVADGGAPFLDPSFVFDMMHHRHLTVDPADTNPDLHLKAGNEWVHQNLGEAVRKLDQQKQRPPALPGFFPVTLPDLLVFRSYDGIYAVASRDHVANGAFVPAGRLRWFHPADAGVAQLATSNEKSTVFGWWSQYLGTNMVSLLFENPLLGSLAHDGQNVYFVDDIGLPPFPAMNNGEFPNGQNQGATTPDMDRVVRASTLKALSLDRDGALAWSLGPTAGKTAAPPLPPLSEEEEDKTTSAHQLCQDVFFLGAPLPVNGRLYVLIERNGRMRLLCLDPRNLVPVPGRANEMVPSLVWSQRLGQPNNPLPGDSVRRFQGAFLAAGEGIVICPTNSGAVIAVDAMSRSLLWAHKYRAADPGEAQPGSGGGRGRFGRGRVMEDGTPPPQLSAERWRAAAPIVVNGKVVFSAYDSDHLDCLDLRTGKLLWRTDRKKSDLYVGGVANDKLIVVGKDEVRAYHLNQTQGTGSPPEPKVAWVKETRRVPSGHGVVAKGAYFLPVRPDPDQRESGPEVWALNVETGEFLSKTTRKKRDATTTADPEQAARLGTGNLVFHEGRMFAQSAWEVAAFPQLEVKKAEMDRLLTLNPNDPKGLTDRGALLLDDGKVAAAIADLKKAALNRPPPEVERELKLKLYQAFTELLKADFAAAEPYLGEYKGLCKLTVEPDLDAADRARVADENVRREGLYLSLVAKGRESQGRLVEAFDHYLAFAGLEDGRQLVPVHDEPGVLMRPDVWARGRIEAMVRRATDPAARKPLEERVKKEWEGVRGGGDRAKLREFVDVFGPYFPVGAEAQLRLAEELLASPAEAESREAQTHLAQLRATADDPVVRARATEALARLMIKSELLEDAVGLYAQLGKEFAAVKVRGDKTGADFFTDLLTDKRLLPYLEPGRYQWPGRVKVEQREQANNGQQQTFVVEPEGELLPFYRRYRLVMDQASSGNGTWTLKVQDRLTGAERCKFTGMRPLPNNGYMPNGGAPFRWSVLANGHLLLVHLGQFVYCLDLAERKERWQYNLLGEAVVNGNPPQPGVGPDGETVLQFDEGFVITLGRAAVLQPGYVCLVARDELIAFEPLTGKRLWARKSVPARTQVFGDGRNLLLVEAGTDRRPSTTRLLRAVDGAPVEGFKDFAKELGAAKSYRVYGRHVLFTEGTGEAPRVARLYDTVTGKDVWRKEFGAGAIPVKTQNPEWVGFVLTTGELTVLSGRTGEPVGGGRVDEFKREEHMKGCTEAVLLHDAERFFLVLDRESGPAVRRGGFQQNAVLKSVKVNGPMYCFDRATGKRLWFADRQFENQMLLTEHFAELPVVIAAAQLIEENGQATYKVVIVEKDRGKLRFFKGLPQNGQIFHAIVIDPKAAKIELQRYNDRLVITCEDETKTAAAP